MSETSATNTKPATGDELCFTPATELARMLREREVSARELLEAHLDRIERVNPTINAIVTLDVDGARAQAARADEELAHGRVLGVLHGLPAAHKDTHATGGMRSTSGSPTLANHVPVNDELVVARMREAGAIRVGKTNVPEFAAGSHTFNPIFGVTRNPYPLDRSAGGSSGGAVAALAAGLIPVAEGSDMGGSLRNPAAFCNVVGLRPTPGRVPTHPAVNGFSTLSVQGPMGRTVADACLDPQGVAQDARLEGGDGLSNQGFQGADVDTGDTVARQRRQPVIDHRRTGRRVQRGIGVEQ